MGQSDLPKDRIHLMYSELTHKKQFSKRSVNWKEHFFFFVFEDEVIFKTLLTLATSRQEFESSRYLGGHYSFAVRSGIYRYNLLIYSFFFSVWRCWVVLPSPPNCYMQSFRSLRPECLQIRKIIWWHILIFLPNFMKLNNIPRTSELCNIFVSLTEQSASISSWKLRFPHHSSYDSFT